MVVCGCGGKTQADMENEVAAGLVRTSPAEASCQGRDSEVLHLIKSVLKEKIH